jgi:gamma-glutamyltranspeptidase / glutathione hydrolase
MIDSRDGNLGNARVSGFSGAVSVMAEQCQARGPHGAVAAAAPTAALVGAQMLRAGGNAYDAAVAAALAETVLLPPKCGLAGDLVALAWHGDRDEPEALLGIGGAPAGLAAVALRGEMRATGPMSVGVPGAPAGYLALVDRARLPLERLAAPAIEMARGGFCWSRICSLLSEESASLVARYNPVGTRYYPNNRVIPAGAVTRLPGLAAALESLVRERSGFLAGDVGDAILACVRRHGGILTRADLETAAAAEWVAPARGELAARPLFVTPAPTHGPALLRALSRIEPSATDPAVTVHSGVVEALRWQDRELADPSGTSMVSAADREGTLVTIVHSNSYPRFGSGLVAEPYDLILANRAGRGFSDQPGHPNFPIAGRRPATTLHAWAVSGPGRIRWQGATPGGDNQMPWNAQTLARMASGGTDIGLIIVAPRWQWNRTNDSLTVEAGFEAAELEMLRSSAARLTQTGLWELRSAMQIVTFDADSNVASAAVDPRTVGAALAF